MKKITLIFIAVLGLGFLFSCTKETKDPVLDISQTVKQAITSPANGSEFVLLQDQADSLFTAFHWSEIVYNLTDLEATNYILQMDVADSNFVNAVELINTTETFDSISIGVMNEKLLGMGLSTGEPHNIEFRVLAYINTDTDYSNVYSDVITLTITPYSGVVVFASLYVPGDYQGWNPAIAPKIYDFDNDGVYNGYIYFPEGGTFEFKFTSDPDWDHTNYGNGGAGVLNTDNGAGNLTVPGAGGYALVVDINALTWSYTLQNWGVIGEWLGWSSDIDMVWDIETQDLSVTVENIPAAANQRFKYRANDNWDVNLGAKTPDDGTLVQGGADIPIPDGGTITFILRFTTPEPTYEIQTK
jgi:starch-binding outer membrane protein SusE/F